MSILHDSIFSVPKSTQIIPKLNKKHPSVPRKHQPIPSSISCLLPDHKPAYQRYSWDTYCRFGIQAARPESVTSLDGKKNPAYAIPGVYFFFLVPRNEINRFYQLFDSSDFDTLFQEYGCYVGESQATKPSDRMGGRINSFKNSILKQLSGGSVPARGKGPEASAYHVAKNMLSDYDQYVDQNGSLLSMSDCLFFSYVDARHIEGVNGKVPSIFWVERSLISLYENNGKMVNTN